MKSIFGRLIGRPAFRTDVTGSTQFLTETDCAIEVRPPLYIQITDVDASRACEDIVRDVIRDSGRPNPEEVKFTTGEISTIEGMRFMEFKCTAGSIWCLMFQAVNNGTIKRCLAHMEDRGNGFELRIIQSKN